MFAKVRGKLVSVGGDTIVIKHITVQFSLIVPVLAANILAAYKISIFKFSEEIDITLFGC